MALHDVLRKTTAVTSLSVTTLIIASLSACSYIPFTKKTDAPPPETKKTETAVDKRTGQQMERIDDKAGKPGDIKVIDGIEYIYARNKRYMLTPDEPEYVWVRKDQYSPGLGEALLGGSKKDREEMEKRIARLEAELKKKGLTPQMVYPSQMMQLPPGLGGYMSLAPMVNFNFPSPKMRRRVVILPLTDQTNYKGEQMAELATRRLVSKLESSGTILTVDPGTLNTPAASMTDPKTLKQLNELYGVQAVIKGTLSDVYISTTRLDGKEDKEASFAMSKLNLDIYNAETGSILKQLSGRNPVSLSREKGDMSSEKAKIKAVDLTITVIAEDLLRSILSLDWNARIASIEEGKVYINAGRLSNLAKGDILEVFSPGQEKIDMKTNASLGRVKGTYKGELEVMELFGVDAAWAKVKKGTNFASSDFVFLKGQ